MEKEDVTRELSELVPLIFPPPPAMTVTEVLRNIRDLFEELNPELFAGSSDADSECDFAGVECDAAGMIIGLVLEDVNPEGEFGSVVGGAREAIERLIELAPNLETLIFTNANLGGDIPSSWPPSLQVLRCRLSKALCGATTDVSKVVSLAVVVVVQVLDLSFNQLSGELASSNLNDLPNLQVLNLANNFLEGELPDFSSSVNLEAVNVSSNLLEGEIVGKFGDINLVLNVTSNR